MNTQANNNNYHFVTAFQDHETLLYEIKGKFLTEEELNKLRALQPQTTWCIIRFRDYSAKGCESEHDPNKEQENP